MAPKRTTKPGRTTSYYRDSPESYAKKLAYDRKRNKRPSQIKYRNELTQARRDRGIEGKGGKDLSHTSKGTLVLEDPKKNRARNGSGKNARLKIVK